MNELKMMLEYVGCGTIAYADDLVLTISGSFAGTVSDRLQLALNKVGEWEPTLVVLFTRKYRPQPIH